jgi:hypothetical protein
LLLSQRLNEKYVESQEIIKNIFLLLEDIAQDECEMEWLVTLWCKIKRDICKSNSKKPTEAKPLSDMTIADLLDIKKANYAISTCWRKYEFTTASRARMYP